MAIAVGLFAGLLLTASDARAQASGASCDIYEIEATNDGSGVDGGLSKLAGTLKKPPFNSWKSHKLLKKHSKSVAVKHAVNVGLAEGGSLDLALKDVAEQSGKKPRLRIGVVLTNQKGKDTKATTEIDSGEPFLIGGEALAGKPKSAYFVGIACAAK